MDFQSFKNRDKNTFKKVFDTFYESLCLFANRIIHDQMNSEDIAQQSFIALWENCDNIENEQHIKSFLYQTTKNNAINYLKHEKIKDNYSKGVDVEEDITHFNYIILEVEIERIMRSVENQLAPQCCKIFILAMSGFNNEEIAEKMSLSVNTVKTQKKIAYAKLKGHISSLYILAMYLNMQV